MNSTVADKGSMAFHDVLRPRSPLISGISDYGLSLMVPVVVHWLTAAIYETFQRFEHFQRYRIHTSEEELAKNTISRLECLRGVLLVQVRDDVLLLLLSWPNF